MNSIPQPSIKSLIWALFTSLLLALVIFVVAVLPAEFNIDPTGLGKKMGLTVLSQTVDSGLKPSAISCPEADIQSKKGESAKSETILTQTPNWQDTVIINIPPKNGLEYKFHIRKGELFEFVWKTNGTALYFDFHGDPDGNTTGYFKSFKESTQSQSSGTLTVPFTGKHGWYWENKTSQTVTVCLKTRGNYKIIGLL